jgi:hypothetical protein
MKKKVLLSLSMLLFAGLMWFNMQQVQVQNNSDASEITMVELEQTVAQADMGTGGMVCQSQWSCSVGYSDGPDPVDDSNVCCISQGSQTGKTQSS